MKPPPIPLLKPGTDKVLAYACPVCESAFGWHGGETALYHATQCCPPFACPECGAETKRQFWPCNDCSRKQAAERRAKTLRDAPKVMADKWTGPVHEDGCDTGWHASLDALRAQYDGDELPRWVWGCENRKLGFDASDIIEDALSDAPEESASEVSGADEDDLQWLLDAWAEQANVTWFEETTTIVVLDPTWLNEIGGTS